jgi:type IV pilus assembly protein PilN
MTTRINLLPWREELRRERKVRFLSILGIAALAALGVWYLVTLYFDGLIAYQNSRNQYLQTEIAALDEKIKEVRNLEEQIQRLKDRMQAIQELQVSRPDVVRLFDELIKTLPEGVFLKEVNQKGNQITIRGVAQSNARVSNFMRNIETSDAEVIKVLGNPVLNVIENQDDKSGRRVANFTLRVTQVASKQGDEGEEAE